MPANQVRFSVAFPHLLLTAYQQYKKDVNHILDISSSDLETIHLSACVRRNIPQKGYSDSQILCRSVRLIDNGLLMIQLLIQNWCKMLTFWDTLLDETLLSFRDSVKISYYHCIFLAMISTYSTWPCWRPRRPSPWKTYPWRRRQKQKRRGKIGRAPVTIRRSQGRKKKEADSSGCKLKISPLGTEKKIPTRSAAQSFPQFIL